MKLPAWAQRNNEGPPDLDEAIRNLQAKLSGVFGGRRGETHVQFEQDPIAIPAGVREHAGVLGAQHQDRIEPDDQLVVVHRLQLARQRVGEALGFA